MSLTGVRPRVLVFAYSEVGVACLEALLHCGAHVVAVFAHEDDSEENIWFRSVTEIAGRHNLSVSTRSPSSQEGQIWVEALRPDIIFSFYYRRLIPADVLALATKGAYNMHGSLLPKLRGRACINWAVILGEQVTGATLHVMTDEVDRGDIVDQKSVDILYADTAVDVFRKVALAAADIVERTFPLIAKGNISLTTQDESQASFYGRRTPADGQIDWSQSALAVYNLVRGVTHPFPGAFTYLGERKIFIWSVLPQEGSASTPGEIMSLSPLVVSTGCGLVRIITLQVEGEDELEAAVFAEKALRVGDRFDAHPEI